MWENLRSISFCPTVCFFFAKINKRHWSSFKNLQESRGQIGHPATHQPERDVFPENGDENKLVADPAKMNIPVFPLVKEQGKILLADQFGDLGDCAQAGRSQRGQRNGIEIIGVMPAVGQDIACPVDEQCVANARGENIGTTPAFFGPSPSSLLV